MRSRQLSALRKSREPASLISLSFLTFDRTFARRTAAHHLRICSCSGTGEAVFHPIIELACENFSAWSLEVGLKVRKESK